MSVAAVERRVERIDGMTGDNESAHVEEDRLYQDVLASIADGAPDPRGLARAALKVRDIQFDRWYA